MFRKAYLRSQLYMPHIMRPWRTTAKNAVVLSSKSQRLMLTVGIIEYGCPGFYRLLPLGLRALEKLIAIIDQELQRGGCQKLQLCSINEATLWQKTGRYERLKNDMFTFYDRADRELLLAPTHEEGITELVSKALATLSALPFPWLLYQITQKYRDEINPIYGLLRSREFVMKDLYSFDLDVEHARSTYDHVADLYRSIFKRLGLKALRVKAKSGDMGGVESHEFHLPCSSGQDYIWFCDACETGFNEELVTIPIPKQNFCDACSAKMRKIKTIEIAHTFLLGTKYTEALDVTFHESGPLFMGCYGIGVTRLLAASVEFLSTDKELRWPPLIAPFKIAIIPPKDGSIEQQRGAGAFADYLIESLPNKTGLENDVYIDNRGSFTVGFRLMETRRIGFPVILVVNKSAVDGDIPRIEVLNFTDGTNGATLFLTHQELVEFLNEKL